MNAATPQAYLDHKPPHAVGVLVCLPGVNSGAYLFEDAVKALGPYWRIIRLTVPGVDGVPLSIPFSARQYAQHAWRVLDELEITQPVAILGHSLGGFAAQEMVRAHPARVQRLVLVSTSRGQPDMASDLNAMQLALGINFWQLAQEIDRDPWQGLRPLFGNQFVANHPDAYDAFVKQRTKHLPSSTASMAHVGAGGVFSSVSWVHRLECPTLVIHGTEDKLIRLESAKHLAQDLPNGRFLELFGIGHFPMLEHPHFWEYVRTFLSGAVMGVTLGPREGWWGAFKGFLFRHG